MTDTGRLATDRAYWDSVAPEGAEAFIDGVFTKWDRGRELRFNRPIWRESPAPGPVKKYLASRLFEVVLRPTAREEWIDGLPPVGTECEANDVDHGWISATVIAYDEAEGVAVCKTVYGYDGYGELRPIRTPEQREQEALALSIQNAFEGITRIKLHDEKALAIAGILMDQGYRKADDK